MPLQLASLFKKLDLQTNSGPPKILYILAHPDRLTFCLSKDHMNLHIYGPAHKISVLNIANAHMPLINAHVGLSREASGIDLDNKIFSVKLEIFSLP